MPSSFAMPYLVRFVRFLVRSIIGRAYGLFSWRERWQGLYRVKFAVSGFP